MSFFYCFHCCNFSFWNHSGTLHKHQQLNCTSLQTMLTHALAQLRNWTLPLDITVAFLRYTLLLPNDVCTTGCQGTFTISSQEGQPVDYCGEIASIYLKSKKSNAVIVSRIENCSTSNFRIIEILFIRVITFSMFLSSLTCRKMTIITWQNDDLFIFYISISGLHYWI